MNTDNPDPRSSAFIGGQAISQMGQLLAYQIGGVFLLVALLMFATIHGLVPKVLRGNAIPALFAILAMGFVAYFYGADLGAWWRSSPPSGAPPAPAPVPGPVAHRPRQQAAPPEPKVIVWPDDVPIAQPEPAPLQPVAKSEPTQPSVPVPAFDPDQNSPYDSKAKRAIKSIGRALHLHKNNDQ